MTIDIVITTTQQPPSGARADATSAEAQSFVDRYSYVIPDTETEKEN